ncbi:MAG: LacI family DNA-binding transcriptional regulator [Bacillota bacterium]|uniref:Substrate-binding domain-containing protein n=1 Tax=Thermanaerosceptrum fracticalcis TaxID=1712410 RepID=A0A7G6E597_THEFR|nr:LacI family DNA-binding transcriptional regulator [Thermanaerosceptrum fracticalcis]QNB47251.1 substrate-binding domain-containing protein [Thermanaerosceptrum fracticalcis]
MVNIRQVAKKAGVSVATVSRVLNHPDTVSPRTMEQVLETIKELRYTPNGLARSLALKKTSTIALLIPNILNPLYPQVAKGVEDVAHQKGYNVLLCNTEEKEHKERDYLEMLIEKRVDGLILTSSLLRKVDFDQIKEKQIPFVMIGKNEGNIEANRVFTDYILGGYLATQHLIEIGYTAIAHISGPKSQLASREKLQGYKKALQEANISLDERYIVEGDNEIEGGYLGVKKLLKLPEPPQAIFAANDLMAIGAIDAIKSEGLRIPEDVAIVGFDDIKISSLIEPKLTTISQPVYKMGLIAARLLFDCIENNLEEDDFQQNIFIQPKLMVRKSCGCEERVREIFN